MKHLRMRTVTTSETRTFEKAVAQAASMQMKGQPAIEGPVELKLVFMLSGRNDVWPVGQGDGDLDNLEKSVSDALNGITYSDDRMIVSKQSWKVCIDGPDGIWISVSPARNDAIIEALDVVGSHAS
ncbi:RusA family crossover junction endodeoxyribonuclease [Salipiger mucosus]|nr:RusA family crossover junction endodeoxyribonuclease [Salipiger mucosus]